MGVADSKLLAQTVLSACCKAETEGKSSLDGNSLWGNEVNEGPGSSDDKVTDGHHTGYSKDPEKPLSAYPT